MIRGPRWLAGAVVLLCAACGSDGAPSRPRDAGANRVVDAVAESAVVCPLVESTSPLTCGTFLAGAISCFLSSANMILDHSA